MRILYSLFVLAFLAAAPVRAQITLTAADLQAQLKGRFATTSYFATNRQSLATVAADKGANRTWDLRAAAFALDTVLTFQVVSAPVPGSGDPFFATANQIVRSEGVIDGKPYTTYSFGRLSSDQYVTLGGVTIGDFDDTTPGDETMTSKFTPNAVAMKLPLTMGTSWTSEYQILTEPALPLPVTVVYKEESVVEGWGTLVLPGLSKPALMIRERTTTTSTFMGNTIVSVMESVQFTTKDGVSAGIYLDEQGNVTGADYSVTSAQPSTGVDGPDGGLPETIALGANFPNPFNPQTTIPFELRQGGHARLEVFDLVGRRVATLVDGMLPAGAHTALFEASGLPTGAYLYRLTAEGTTQQRILTLLK